MLQYLVRRLLLFIPMLLVISFLAFGLNQCTPGDPIDTALEGANLTPSAYSREYRQKAAALGLDKPAFYLNLTSAAYPDTLYRIVPKRYRKAAAALIAQYGNWPEISGWFDQLDAFKSMLEIPGAGLTTQNRLMEAEKITGQLRQEYDPGVIHAGLDSIGLSLSLPPALPLHLSKEFEKLHAAYRKIIENQSRWKRYVPVLQWHGFENRYHHWLTGILKGDFGTSLKDGRPVSIKIKEAVRWTLTLNIAAILLAYLLSVPIGVYTAVHKGGRVDRILSTFLFALDSMPVFWMASLLIIFFTTPEYGMNFFRVLGPFSLSPDASFTERLLSALVEMILPIFCITYGSLAFMSRQVRSGMIVALQQDYIRTARAKGMRLRTVIWKHAFRNALFPLITLFAHVFPAAMAGSVIIEYIFNIPGMGQLMIKSIQGDDWPVIYTILMLASLLTMVGMLVADLLYKVADPRVNLNDRTSTRPT